MDVLAGDIGGTNARLAIVNQRQILIKRTYRSSDFPDFLALLDTFFSEISISLPKRACFGIAGTIKECVATGVNLPWKVDGLQIKSHFNFEKVKIINDFAAAALGVLQIGPEWLIQIGAGKSEPDSNKAVIGPGTGLGEAMLVALHNGNYKVLETEGGHCDFAPSSQEDVKLLQFLWDRFGHVSYERILSGPGLINIYNFFTQQNHNINAADITKAAKTGSDQSAIKTLDIFCRALGAEAGNLALKGLAKGGVYITGGIAPHIVELLAHGPFRSGFENKGRLAPILKDIPTYVVTNKDIGLLGAAAKALEL